MDELLSLLERAGGVRTLVIVAGLVVGLVLVGKLLSRPKASAHHATSRCSRCGWTGSVSKYKPVCPRCGNAMTG